MVTAIGCVRVFACVHKNIFCTRNDERSYISTCFVLHSFQCECECFKCVCVRVCVQLFCVDNSTDFLLKCQQLKTGKQILYPPFLSIIQFHFVNTQ